MPEPIVGGGSERPAPTVFESFELWNRSRSRRFYINVMEDGKWIRHYFCLDLDVAYVRSMVKKARRNKSRRSSDGPITIGDQG